MFIQHITLYDAIFHRNNPVGRPGNLRIMRREENGHAKSRLQIMRKFHHNFAVLLIKGTCCLVTEKEPRAFDHSPRDRGSLLLSPGELSRKLMQQIFQLDTRRSKEREGFWGLIPIFIFSCTVRLSNSR